MTILAEGILTLQAEGSGSTNIAGNTSYGSSYDEGSFLKIIGHTQMINTTIGNYNFGNLSIRRGGELRTTSAFSMKEKSLIIKCVNLQVCEGYLK